MTRPPLDAEKAVGLILLAIVGVLALGFAAAVLLVVWTLGF